MKKLISHITVIICLTAAACNGNTGNSTGISKVPSVIDTMAVVHPGNFDSSGTIITPPVNDNNVIIPDTNKAVE